MVVVYDAGVFKPSRTFKENVLAVGFLILSIAVVVIFVVVAWKGRTSPRPAPARAANP
jgi:hypothetical protein